MSENNVPKFNPETRRAHRREKRRQIYAPVMGVALLMVAVMVLMLLVFTQARYDQVSIVADSLFVCFTLLPCVIAALVIFVINAFLVAGVGYMNDALPRPFKKLQDGAAKLGEKVTDLMRTLGRLTIRFLGWLKRLEYLAGGLPRIANTKEIPPEKEKG